MLTKESLDQLNSLTPEQRQVALKILKDTLETNKSSTLNEMLETDYDEIPVDIDTFLTDPRYLGKFTNNGKNLTYRKWPEALREWFPNPLAPSPYVEIALTGCLSANTKIAMLDGTNLTIKELYDKYLDNPKNNGKDTIDYVYSFDVNKNKYVVGELTRVFYTGKKDVYKITLDNGESITCSKEHPFMTRDKHWKTISSGLSIGESLMPFNRYEDNKGYEVINHPQKDGSFIKENTHRITLKYKYGDNVKGAVHHKDLNKRNNKPMNITKSTWMAHRMYHAKSEYAGNLYQYKYLRGEISKEEYKKVIKKVQQSSVKSRWIDNRDENCKLMKQITTNRMKNGFAKELSNKHWNKIDKENRVNYMREHKIGFMADSEYNTKYHPNLLKINREDYLKLLHSCYDKKDFIDKAINQFECSKGGVISFANRINVSLDNKSNYIQNSWVNSLNKSNKKLISMMNDLYNENNDITDELFKNKYKYSKFIPSECIKQYFNNDKDKFVELVANYNHKIVNIEYIGEEDTYDLTVRNYHNFCLSSGIVSKNSIGIGKSTNFDYAGCYFLYKLMCLKDPNSYYGQPGSTLWFCFFNNTLNSANSAAYGKFQAMLQSSPWFMERGSLSGTKNVEYIPDKNIRFMVGSTLQHTLGVNIIWAALDEVNFKNGKNISMEQSKIFEMYSIILERISSRYLVNGRPAGMMFLASSKQSQYDFLENYIQKKVEENKRKPKSERTFYCFDESQWNVLPASKYPSGKTFKIACQNPMLPNKIIEPDEETPESLKELEQNGYRIIDVPMELYDKAKMSLDNFLMNTAGIASTLASKYLHPSLYIENEYEHIERPFEKEVLEIGLKDKLRIIDFFNPKALGDSIIHKKLYMHIDTSLTGDRTGISCIAISGYKHQKKYSDTGEEYDMNELVYRQLFTIGIQAPKGDQISFQKTREFIYYLKKQLGWNIQMVTTDGFQSADLRQSLTLAGIPSGYISLDKTPDGYETFKIALQENRAILILHEYQPLLFAEFQNVERNNMSGKVDHTIDGSKDLLDSLVGSIYSASKNIKPEEIYSLENYDVLLQANTDETRISANPINNLFFKPPEETVKSYAEKQNEKMDLEVQTIKKLRAEMSKEENINTSDAQLLEMLSNSTLDDDMLIF